METRINNSILELIQGDITELDTDAVVNAANGQLVIGADFGVVNSFAVGYYDLHGD